MRTRKWEEKGAHPPMPRMEMKKKKKKTARVAEMAGETAANCTAICCCCPCGFLYLFFLAFLKLPVGLVRRALRGMKHRRRCHASSSESCANCKARGRRTALLHSYDSDTDSYLISDNNGGVPAIVLIDTWPGKEAVELEKEMWGNFYSAGFWRSLSQRD